MRSPIAWTRPAHPMRTSSRSSGHRRGIRLRVPTSLGRPVRVLALDDALPDALSAIAESGGRVAVAAYLLGEGVFYDTLRAHAAQAPVVAVTEPLGAHPAIAR